MTEIAIATPGQSKPPWYRNSPPPRVIAAARWWNAVDIEQRPQVRPGVIAELRGLLVQLRHRLGQRLALIAQVPAGGGGRVVLGAGPRVQLAVDLSSGRDQPFGLADLLKDLLNVRSEGLL